jgi:hypothetical protein
MNINVICVHRPNGLHIKLRHTNFITNVEKSFGPSGPELKKSQFAINNFIKILDSTHKFILFFMAQQSLEGQGLIIIRGFTITFRHHNLYDSFGRVISPTQTPLPDNVRYSQQTYFHAQAGFKPAIPDSEQSQTHALHRAFTGILVGSYVTIYVSRKISCNTFLSLKLTLADMFQAFLTSVEQKF